jgi:hypothetical protein
VKRKDQMKTKVVELVEESNDKGSFAKCVRLDDGGENASIEKAFHKITSRIDV